MRESKYIFIRISKGSKEFQYSSYLSVWDIRGINLEVPYLLECIII